MEIGSSYEQLVAVERHVFLDARPNAFRKFARVMPQFVDGRSIKSLDVIVITVDKDDAAMNKRRCFVLPRWKRQRPRDAQIFYVVFCNLADGAEAQIVIGSPPRQPVPCRR